MLDIDVEKILSIAIEEIEKASDIMELEKIRVKYLGKKGEFTDLLKNLGKLSKDERPKFGKIVNLGKEKLQTKIEKRKKIIKEKEIDKILEEEKIDITLSGRSNKIARLHPITKTFDRMINFFANLGFLVADGPEIEDVYHNFEALNIPEHHPARAMHDTFYFENGDVLRTHTSTIQIHATKGKKPPIRIIAPGRVYRCDSDVTHTPMFHQLEGFMIDEDITFANLKGVLSDFIRVFFEKDLSSRFRPSYFPFTEPSAELDMQCFSCGGDGCKICSNTGWLEIAGCGMIHPVVLKNCGIDSEKYSGFAFGFGVDRIAMLRYGINDLRINFENDLRFLEQF